MQHEIRNKPDYASLHVHLDEGEQLVTESGAMMGMDPALKMESNLTGGLLGAAKRAVGGESIILNTYTGTGPGQRLDVAPSAPGDLEHVRLDGQTIIIQRGSYCASTKGIDVSAKWGGAKTFFGGEGLIMLKASGTGDMWMSSYGAIRQVDVTDGFTLDTGHIVAFDESLSFTVGKTGGLKSLFFSSEGLVCKFTGKGRLWMQTRDAPSLAAFLHPFRPIEQKKN